jgi:hypothetical protein
MLNYIVKYLKFENSVTVLELKFSFGIGIYKEVISCVTKANTA